MRIRFLASLVVAAAALILPSGAFAFNAPSVQPSSTTVTANQPHLTWDDVRDQPTDFMQYNVWRGDGSCGVTTNLAPITTVDADTLTFTDSVTDGTYCYFVEADSIVEQKQSAQVTITYDHTAPLVSMLSPSGGSVHGNSVSVSADANDGTGVGVTEVDFFAQKSGGPVISIGTQTTPTPHYNVTWNTTSSVPDGTYNVWATATDGLTSRTSVATQVLVDNNGPSVSVIAPTNPSIVHGASVLVSADANDGAGLGVAEVDFFAQKSGGPVIPIGTQSAAAPHYDVHWDTTGVVDGTYSVWATATDTFNPAVTSAIIANVGVDNTPPTGSISAPLAGAVLHGASNAVTASVTEAGPGVTSVRFETSPNGTTWTQLGAIDTSSPYSVNWNTTGITAAYFVHAVITDGSAHTFTTPDVSVTLDNTFPTGTVDVPVAAAVLHGVTNPLSATASDVGSSVQSVQFEQSTSSSGPWTAIGGPSPSVSSPYIANWDTTGLSAALFVHAVITDAAGNAFSTPAVSVVVDNTKPGPPGTPTGFTTVQSAPSFNWPAAVDPGAAAASGVDHYNVFRDGGTTPIGAPVVAPTTTFLDSVGLANGFHTYTVVAVDKAGNASDPSPVFTVFLDSAAISAPTNVTALASPTSQRPQISWTAPVAPGFNIEHYDIFRVGVTPRVGFVPSTVTTFTDNSASLPDNSYAYVVVAVSDTAFSGVASGATGIVYDTTAPGAPGSISATAALDGSVNVAWIASGDGAGSGIAKYVVRRSSSAVPPATIADGDATCQVTATSCSDAAALNGKLYSYAVFAVDRAGNTSLAGSSPPVTARDQAPPAVPTGLSATPGDGSVSLKWAPAGSDDDVAGYVLVAKQGTQAPTSDTDGLRVCSTIVGTSSACDAGGLTNGAMYTFGLFALDEALNRSQPAVVSAAPNGKVDDVQAPAAASKLKIKIVGNKVTLTWKNPADRDFDHVVITSSAVKPSANKAGARVYSGKGTTATIKVAPGQSRWFVVVAYDAVGNASAPASIQAVVKAVSPFGPAPKAKVHGKVRLSWPTVKGARYYNVQIYAGKHRVAVGWPAGHSLVVPHAKLHKGVKYTWYVWPGLGAKAKAHYGKLIGKNVFTYAG